MGSAFLCILFSDFAVFRLVLFNAVPNQNLTVGGTTFIISNYMELIKHYFIYSDGVDLVV